MDHGTHSEQFKSRLSSSSRMVSEIASYSDDASSSIEAPLLDDDYPGDEQHCNQSEVDDDDNDDDDDDDDEGNDHAVTTTEDKVGEASGMVQEQRKPNASRVAARLNQARTGCNKNVYRSPDLQPLQQDYYSLKKCLRSILNAAKAYCEATKELGASQDQFMNDFGALAIRSPLQSFVLKEQGSLIEVQEKASVYHEYNISEYQQQIIAYIEDWLATISNQLDEKLLLLAILRATRQEYEKKMESLLKYQRSQPESFDKDSAKTLDDTQQKMYAAIQEHEEACSNACCILDQAVRHGWKDLYPLVNKMMKWELNQLGRDNKSYGQFLPETLNKLTQTTIASLEVDLMKKRDQLNETTRQPESFYGKASDIADYLDYLPPDVSHLFLSDACPHSQMAWIALLETERNPYDPTNFQMHYVCNFLKYKDPGYKLLSKLGIVETTPVLIHKGNVFRESNSLLEYIGACFPETPYSRKETNGVRTMTTNGGSISTNRKRLAPSDPVDAFNMSLFLDRYMDLPILFRKVLTYQGSETKAVFSSAGQALLELLEQIDSDVQKFPGSFLCGYSFTLADIFVLVFVERIQIVLSHYQDFEIPNSMKHLRSWYKVVQARSSVKISMADRTGASLSTLALSSQKRRPYLIEYYEASRKRELDLCHRAFELKGAPGENPYRLLGVARTLAGFPEKEEENVDFEV